MENKPTKICQKCGNTFHENQPCITNFTEFVWFSSKYFLKNKINSRKYGGKEVSMIGSWSKWQVKIPMKQDPVNTE